MADTAVNGESEMPSHQQIIGIDMDVQLASDDEEAIEEMVSHAGAPEMAAPVKKKKKNRKKGKKKNSEAKDIETGTSTSVTDAATSDPTLLEAVHESDFEDTLTAPTTATASVNGEGGEGSEATILNLVADELGWHGPEKPVKMCQFFELRSIKRRVPVEKADKDEGGKEKYDGDKQADNGKTDDKKGSDRKAGEKKDGGKSSPHSTNKTTTGVDANEETITHKTTSTKGAEDQSSSGQQSKDDKPPEDRLIEDEALYATCHIPTGESIITEPPIIALPANSSSMNDIYNAFLSLSPSEQSAFMALKPAAPLQYHETTVMIDSLVDHYLPLHDKYTNGEDMGEHEHYLHLDLGERIQLLGRGWRVLARFNAHCHSLTNLPAEERDTIPADVPVTGVFLTVARLSHSCMPNCHAAYNPHTGRMNVHTTRPIVPGEALTISSIANAIWYQGREQRSLLLSNQNPDVTCFCPACDPKHPDYRRHELLRSKVHLNTIVLQTFLTGEDAKRGDRFGRYKARMKDGSGVEATIFSDTLEPTEVDEYFDAERKLLENIRLLTELGCADTELSRWRNALINVIYPTLGQHDKALQQAKEGFECAVKCWGKDHPEIGPLERGLNRAEKVVEERAKAREEQQREARMKMMKGGRKPTMGTKRRVR